MKFWRKIAKKGVDGTRNGRMIRNMMSGSNQRGMLSHMHVLLLRAAGIATPVYDAQQKERDELASKYNKKSKTDIQDVEFEERFV